MSSKIDNKRKQRETEKQEKGNLKAVERLV
jgi:hypothetical protein